MGSERILIIDDEPGAYHNLVGVLEAEGAEVAAVRTGREGVRKVQAEQFDVALVNLILPDMDGLELFRKMKESRPDLICMLISEESSSRQTGVVPREGGARRYLKPLVVEELLLGIKEALQTRQLLETLADAEARWHGLLDASKDAVFSIDESGLVLQWNRAATIVFGYTFAEINGRNIRVIIPDFSLENHHRIMEMPQTSGVGISSGYDLNMTGLTKGGTKIPVEVSLSRCQTSKGGCYTGIIRDLRERINLERRFRQAQKMEAIGTLAGGIAHDFNNLLNIIGGYTEMARRMVEPDSEVYKDLTAVVLASRKATELVKQILTIARRSEGPEKEPLLLQSMLKEAVKMLRGAIPTTIGFEIDINESCKAILADQSQIHQVLMNLVTNAYHSMRESGGKLEVSLDGVMDPRSLTADEYLRLVIGDTGHGIPPHIIDRIFEPYFTTKDGHEGTGLGLAITHAIVQAHGGFIRVESSSGKGTRFEVFLPVIDEDPRSIPVREETAETPRFIGNVLLVDDDVRILDIYRKMVEVLGCEAESCISGAAALEIVASDPGRFDLVIVDYVMPEMTGLVVAGELIKMRPNIPVIMVTGYNENIDENKALEAGVQELLLKPINIHLLAETLKKYLSEHKEGTMG